MRTMFRLLALFALLMVAVACTTAEEAAPQVVDATNDTAPAVTDNGTDTDADMDGADMEVVGDPQDAGAEPVTVAYDGPDWATTELVNARTGETFTLADFAGRPVFVEPMATWCSNCRAQQRRVIGAHQALGDEAVFISLSVELGLPDESLAAYADQNGFDWLFAVSPAMFLRALTSEFGRTVSVAPATPHFTIAPDGTVSSLSTGSHSTQAVIDEVRALMG